MSQISKEITVVNIEHELERSYLDYAMSVIVSRALPDVRDGLKPVHRRILYAMLEMGNEFDKPYKKSARIVGDVIGKYHPHGDSAVYDAIVRMAQSFSLRYPLVDGQGNFGSIDGDSPAAMRYTEIRLQKIAHTLLNDLDKNTVDFSPNYDGSEFIPQVLPSIIPNLLINGSSGIAVGMATNIPPHNLSEILDACIAIIDNPSIGIDDLMNIVPGPDFPTAGIINGTAGIKEAYSTGRGKISVRAKVEIIEDKNLIIIKELPYQVNKANLITKIAELVKGKIIEGISSIRDESDKEGMRIVVELKRGEIAEVILNNLYINTQLQVTFGINMVALDKAQPKIFTLKQLITSFINHRREVVTRRCNFLLNQAKERIHILEGLKVALTNIDTIVGLVRKATTPYIAKTQLLDKTWKIDPNTWIDMPSTITENYQLSINQAQAILDMRIQRFTGLEHNKINSEYRDLDNSIKKLNSILQDEKILLNVIRNEFSDIKKLFSDKRLTKIIESKQALTYEDLVVPEDMAVTLSHCGYIKIQAVADYRAQRRGGKGKIAISTKNEDFVEQLLVANNHDTLLCFSNFGKIYWLKVYLLPNSNRISKGKPLINLLPLSNGEKINTILPIHGYDANHYVVMVTSLGTVKKVKLEHFSKPRLNGIIAINLDKDDYLVGAILTDGNQDIILFSDNGKAIRFNETHIRIMSRTTRGVRGMRLNDGHRVIALIIVKSNTTILVAADNGFGKRTVIDEFPIVNRGGKGVIAIKTKKNKVIGVVTVNNHDEIMLISSTGNMVRIRVNEVSLVGRNTKGVKLINLLKSEKLVGIQSIDMEKEQI